MSTCLEEALIKRIFIKRNFLKKSPLIKDFVEDKLNFSFPFFKNKTCPAESKIKPTMDKCLRKPI